MTDAIRDFWGAIVSALGAVIWLVRLEAKASSADSSVKEVTKGAAEHEVRLRSLEANAARGDERYNSIVGLLQSIDRRLERMEDSK